MAAIDTVFVLVLENRSFDHLFGFSGLSGVDAATGEHTAIDGLTGTESNTFQGKGYPVVRGADWAMPADPAHEFPDTLDQLCGPGVRYVPPYPPIHNSGFVDSYDHVDSRLPGEIMKCFDTPRQLPVLHALAEEYAICDHWHASMPGPTWPNRMFVHAATSGGLDHSPSTSDIVLWETLDGFSFKNGSIFDALKRHHVPFHLYSGDEFPMVAALKGIDLGDVHRIDDLVHDLRTKRPFPYRYVFIEPSYEILRDYRGSTSMHPLADVRDGERLVKTVYEAVRASEAWPRSLLVVTWDEHGGFYDHVAPPAAVPPGDTAPRSKHNQYHFTFAQYGVRVPALVISPLVRKGTVDHRVYDHASIPATLEALFGMTPLSDRDKHARSLLPLLSLGAPRKTDTDARAVLPAPAQPLEVKAAAPAPSPLTRESESVNGGALPAILHAAMRQDLLLSPAKKSEILARVAALGTRADALAYLADVKGRLKTK
ncbi:MAG TPA: alkaline phosphatase family protein [Polyangiaceae bacterium]|nr:alkaline phosphatase family protein [Polyangiaceae bacterium]